MKKTTQILQDGSKTDPPVLEDAGQDPAHSMHLLPGEESKRWPSWHPSLLEAAYSCICQSPALGSPFPPYKYSIVLAKTYCTREQGMFQRIPETGSLGCGPT